MNRRAAERLARLYPPEWRARFGEEFVDVLEAQDLGPEIVCDVFRAALAERLFNCSGLETIDMTAYPATVLALAKQPSGLIPILTSLCALALVMATLIRAGVVRQPDEGGAAHLFQLLIVGQLPVVGLFAFKWLREAPRAALTVIALQGVAVALALLPVWYFGL